MPIHQNKEAAAAIGAHQVELRDTLRARVGDLRDAVRAGRPHSVSERAVIGYWRPRLTWTFGTTTPGPQNGSTASCTT